MTTSTCWITDDANHIPVLAEAKVLVGSIKMELSSYEAGNCDAELTTCAFHSTIVEKAG